MKKDRFGPASFRLKAGLRTFRFWLWLIRVIGLIVPRRLAAGMGSRVALSRIVAGRVGASHLANQTRFTAAQPGRVLGCAVVATQTMGGRDVSRFALWSADAFEKPWL